MIECWFLLRKYVYVCVSRDGSEFDAYEDLQFQ